VQSNGLCSNLCSEVIKQKGERETMKSNINWNFILCVFQKYHGNRLCNLSSISILSDQYMYFAAQFTFYCVLKWLFWFHILSVSWNCRSVDVIMVLTKDNRTIIKRIITTCQLGAVADWLSVLDWPLYIYIAPVARLQQSENGYKTVWKSYY
jgi:hypothetical protein